MEHTRKFERMLLVYYLGVTDLETNEVIGHAVDISNEGIMVFSEKPVKTELLFQLQMYLPEEVHESRYFAFSAVSQW